MAGQGTSAEVRVFRTIDGKLVGEHDPRGAFLAYAVGDDVPAERVEEYERVRGGFVAEMDHAVLREQQVNKVPAGPDGDQVFLHEDLATELADTAQELANLPDDVRVEVRRQLAGDNQIVVDRRVAYTEDRDRIVPADHADAAFLAYAPGDIVKAKDVDMYRELVGDDDESDDSDSADDAAPRADADDPAAGEAKARTVAPANKARTVAPAKAADK